MEQFLSMRLNRTLRSSLWLYASGITSSFLGYFYRILASCVPPLGIGDAAFIVGIVSPRCELHRPRRLVRDPQGALPIPPPHRRYRPRGNPLLHHPSRPWLRPPLHRLGLQIQHPATPNGLRHAPGYPGCIRIHKSVVASI